MDTCSVEGCSRTVHARDLCAKHYVRWRTHGDPLLTLVDRAENGAPEEFIKIAINYQNKEGCLFWPYGSSAGYAVLGGSPKGSKNVSRIVCEKVHGPPPTTEHEAAHNCGKGHLGCINPHHLRWDTPKGNAADRVIHGTNSSGEQNGRSKLTWEQVQEIKALLLTSTMTQYEVAFKFGVSQTTISNIWHRKIWKSNEC